MADEPNIKGHRYYAKENHIKLLKTHLTKALILADAIDLIDGAPTIITQVIAPTFGPYIAGDTPADAYVEGTYVSLDPWTIASIDPSWTINGSPALGTDVLVEGDVVGLPSVLVTDSEANERVFGYGVAAGAGPAPVGATLSALGYTADLISVTTDTAEGTIYYLLHNSATPLAAADIKADVLDLSAVGGGTLDPLETDNQPVDWDAVTPGTYWINMVQDNGAFSNVVSLEVTIVAAAYDPAADAELVWDAAEISTLFQDTSAATPVTTSGQSVARMNNRGTLGGDFRNTGATDRPVYTESGAERYLQFDGSNDFIRWLGSDGDIDLTGGFYLVFGMSETSTISDRSFLSAASTSGDAINSTSGFVMYSSDNTTNATAYIGGLLNTNGHEIVDTGGGQLPLSVNEVEVTPATGSANATLRVRRVADGDVVSKGTDTANSGQFPDVATAVAQLCLGSGISGGSPATFTNIRIYCGILKFGAVTSGMRADMRAWVAGKIGF